MIVSPSALTVQANQIVRTKYFPIEFYLANMLPNTAYDAYIDGQLVNAFCKPFGGLLGDPLKSDSTGKLRVQLHYSVQFSQQFLTTPNLNNKLIESSKTITFVDPFNRKSTANIPFLIKAS